MKIGQRVWIPSLQEFGTIEEIQNERVKKVRIGKKIVDVFELIVENWSTIKYILVTLGKLFKIG